MRFLVDQPVSPIVAAWLCDHGHDAIHARDLGLSRAKDMELVALAIRDDRIIITADLDFPRLVALSQRDRPAMIVFRAGNITDAQMVRLVQRVLEHVEPQELERSIIVIDEHRIRVAPLPIKP